MKTLEVLFTPADFSMLPRRNLDDALCVVLDVFRATSSIVTALSNGASAIIPVAEISEALALRHQHPAVLLAGERDGVRIRGELTGGTEFDLGNSPREFTRDIVSGRTIVMTTTNGTRALRACSHAHVVLIGSFLNLGATVEAIRREQTEHLVIVCGGTFDQTAYEDVLAAGALCEAVWNDFCPGEISDSALIARRLFQRSQDGLSEAASESRNGRRLLSRPDLRDDVPFCLQRDLFPHAAVLTPEGKVVRRTSVSNPGRLEAALRRLDEENSRDPNLESVDGAAHPREAVYAGWLTDWVLKLRPEASEELRLAARSQHLCRWMIPRNSHPMTRAGYLQWREALKKFHAQRAGEILREVGYPEDVIQRVQSLNLKRDFPNNAEGRVLEDALCLVFLEHQLADLAAKTADDKVIGALQKSWKKMTRAGQAEALKLPFGPREKSLLQRALNPPPP